MKKYGPIQSLWIGDALSSMEQLCIRSYQEQGHDFCLYVYDQVENVPAGTIIKDAAEIVSPGQLFIDAYGGYVNFSNYFRYALLYQNGGWWADMDTVCIKPFDFSADFVFSSERNEKYNRFIVNTTYMKSPPGAPFLKDCLDFIQVRGNENLHRGELGSNLGSRMIFRNKLEKYIQPPELFCPVSASAFPVFFHPVGFDLPSASYALHWWHPLWKQYQVNKDDRFPENCLYEWYKQLYAKG